MTKYIDKLMGTLKAEFFVTWLIAAIVACLGETDIIPNGLIMPNTTGEFKVNTIVVILTVVGVPLALKLFSLNTTKGLRRMDNDEALKAYHVWSSVRMAILCLDMCLGLAAYYVTLNVTGALCALVALATSVCCWPSSGKISAYLDALNND